MTKVLALDQATRTGWTVGGAKINLPQWISGHFHAPKRDEEGERLCLIEDSCLSLIDDHRPDLIVYEEPFDPTWDALEALKKGKEPRSNFNRNTLAFLQRVKGAVMMAAARRGIPTESYTPRQWQSILEMPKGPELIPQHIATDPQALVQYRQKWRKKLIFDRCRKLGARIETSDEADSWAMCLYACHGKAGAARAQTDLFAREVERL